MKENNRQYNAHATKYSKSFDDMNTISISDFHRAVSSILKLKGSMIDLGCGPGDIIQYFARHGWKVSGVDSSIEMVKLAKENNDTDTDIRCEDFSKTSFENQSFDLVTSKWAMQTTAYIAPIYDEVARLLKSEGQFIFLALHPFRQFIEKKKSGKDYFKKEIVDSIIFDGSITVQEPSHTLTEYLGTAFTKHFELVDFSEGYEFPAAEQIGGDIYPTYMIITARKKF